MNQLAFLFKDLRNIAILVLIIFTGFFIMKSNSLCGKLDTAELNYHNQIAINDTLRTVEKDTVQKLGLIITQRELGVKVQSPMILVCWICKGKVPVFNIKRCIHCGNLKAQWKHCEYSRRKRCSYRCVMENGWSF